MSEASTEVKSLHREDIDGLRALAVCFVVLGHFFPKFAANGFLGVDVFFVISGFVISQQLNYSKKEKFSEFLLNFYSRRIRRLLPALMVTVTITLLLVFLLTLDANGMILSTGVLSLIGISNMYLYQLSIDYFGPDASLNPFTHTWSLGVEEQFYLVFPIFFFLIWKLSSRLFYRAILTLVILGTLLSVALSYLWAESRTNLVFYSMPTRAWELGLGVIAYFASQLSRRKSRILKLGRPVWLLIILGLLIAPGDYGLVGQLMVTSLTAILLYLGQKKSSANILVNRHLVWIGQRSYSIYLIHWPILVFTNYYFGSNLVFKLCALFLVLLMSSMSYTYVENPFRMRNPQNRAHREVFTSTSLVVLLVVTFQFFASPWIVAHSGHIPRALGVKEMPVWQPGICSGARQVEKLSNPIVQCLGGSSTSPKRFVFLVGDSHADHLIPMIQNVFNEKGWQVKNINLENGLDFPNGELTPRSRSATLKFLTYSAKSGDVVVLSFHRGRLNPTRDQHLPLSSTISITQSTRNLVANLGTFSEEMRRKGVKIILVKDTPLMASVYPSQSCARQLRLLGEDECAVSRSQDSHTRYLQEFAFDSLSQRNTNVMSWDPFEYVYRNSKTFSVLREDFTYTMWDWNHITESYAIDIAPSFRDAVNKFVYSADFKSTKMAND